jgi:4-amino-4-deoxy-L-arabinose transferase-like glycosyltransferase
LWDWGRNIGSSHFFIFLFSFNAFLFGIDREPLPFFDEPRYIYAAREFIHRGINQNWSHPPLGKILIAAGIEIFGDRPMGWRLMSAIFGALILNAMFCLGLLLFREKRAAWVVVLLSFFNQMLFVQARIATLDVFMMAGIAWGLVFFLKRIEGASWRYGVASGVSFGLGCAAKWFAAVPLMFCFLCCLCRREFRQCTGIWSIFVEFIFVPKLIYMVIFSTMMGMSHPEYAPPLHPLHGTTQSALTEKTMRPQYSLLDLIPLQWSMLKAQLSFHNPSQAARCEWFTWPLMLKPTWYNRRDSRTDEQAFVESVVQLGNPLILWLGLVAIGVCFWAWIKRRSSLARWIVLLYSVQLLIWALVPRETQFFYYYFPSAMSLSLAIVFALRFLKLPSWIDFGLVLASALIFMYFYPILSSYRFPAESYRSRLWLNSWEDNIR